MTDARRLILPGLGLWALSAALASAPAGAQIFRDGQTAPLSVQMQGDLPGFRSADGARYLSGQMEAAGLTAWNFQPAAAAAAPDRVTWIIQLEPYAGGGVRQFFPMPGVQKLFGPHRLISVELRLYLAGQYQTAVFGQAVIQGGAQDKELAFFAENLSQELLGVRGAYRASDTVPDATVKGPAR